MATFVRRVFWVVAIQRIGVGEDAGDLLKRDAMFFKVGNRLRDIPRKHIHVYTLIRPPVARTEDADDLFGLSGWSGLSCLSRLSRCLDRKPHQKNQRNQIDQRNQIN